MSACVLTITIGSGGQYCRSTRRWSAKARESWRRRPVAATIQVIAFPNGSRSRRPAQHVHHQRRAVQRHGLRIQPDLRASSTSTYDTCDSHDVRAPATARRDATCRPRCCRTCRCRAYQFGCTGRSELSRQSAGRGQLGLHGRRLPTHAAGGAGAQRGTRRSKRFPRSTGRHFAGIGLHRLQPAGSVRCDIDHHSIITATTAATAIQNAVATACANATQVALLRQIMMRPIGQFNSSVTTATAVVDHPNFTGSNPNFNPFWDGVTAGGRPMGRGQRRRRGAGQRVGRFGDAGPFDQRRPVVQAAVCHPLHRSRRPAEPQRPRLSGADGHHHDCPARRGHAFAVAARNADDRLPRGSAMAQPKSICRRCSAQFGRQLLNDRYPATATSPGPAALPAT